MERTCCTHRQLRPWTLSRDTNYCKLRPQEHIRPETSVLYPKGATTALRRAETPSIAGLADRECLAATDLFLGSITSVMSSTLPWPWRRPGPTVASFEL